MQIYELKVLSIALFFRSELSESPKRSLLDSPSPTREQKARQAVAEAAAASRAPKWKMQIGSATAGSSRFKKKPEREEWIDDNEKRINKNGDVEDTRKVVTAVPPPMPEKTTMVIRKEMAIKEIEPKKPPQSELLKKLKPAPPVTKPVIPPGQVVLDKFGNFRLMTPPKELNRGSDDDLPPLPPGAPPKGSYAGIICLSEVSPIVIFVFLFQFSL